MIRESEDPNEELTSPPPPPAEAEVEEGGSAADESAPGERPVAADDDLFDTLLRQFPVPGEIWVHLRSAANYLSSLLTVYPPTGRPTPFVIAGPQVDAASPYRIQYGNANPGMFGVVVAEDRVIPNFSVIPRLAVEADVLADALARPAPSDLLVLPSAHGDTVRVFWSAGCWFVANDTTVEPAVLDSPIDDDGPVRRLLRCLQAHTTARREDAVLPYFLRDLKADRVWFFALYPDKPTMLAVGTCRPLRHDEVGDDLRQQPDVDFTGHGYIAPSIPIIPTQRGAVTQIVTDAAMFDSAPFIAYRGLYDGVLLVNPHTLFALRLCTPDIVYLTPLLQRRRELPEFLAHRSVEARLADCGRHSVDPRTHRWITADLPALTHRLFGAAEAPLLTQIHYHIDTLYGWVGGWVRFVAALAPADWATLEPSLQRLWHLLEYEAPVHWYKILGAPRYHPLVARLIVAHLTLT